MRSTQPWWVRAWQLWTRPAPASLPALPADTLPAPMPAELDLLFEQQAAQVQQLQRQVQLDAVTGLPQRRHFLGLLQQRLDVAAGSGVALLLLRVQQLEALNLRLGFEATDQLLAALGQVLQTYVDRVPGTCAGRLNGSDFALCLPVAGVARETAASLHAALAAAPALRSGRADVAVGGVDGVHLSVPSAVLAAADAALAQAEARGASGQTPVVVEGLRVARSGPNLPPGAASEPGERAWRAQIAAALDEGRVQLQAAPVVDAVGHCLHLECRLLVQRQAGGAFQPAEGWFALARRSRLLPQVDLRTVQLALKAIATDGQARAVPVSALSLLSPGFITEVAAQLAAAPASAALLTVECADSLREAAAIPALAAAAQAWRAWGVRVGVGPMETLAQHLPALKAAGVRHVTLDARALPGLAQDAALRSYVQGLVALVHGLGLTVLAGAVNDAAEAQILWGLGVDAASGAALRPAVAVADSAA
jgi:EAL domain-containing protein (putative c-di-GMP-specific phosphodiesterase class I)/GGDEF domain-containing protein